MEKKEQPKPHRAPGFFSLRQLFLVMFTLGNVCVLGCSWCEKTYSSLVPQHYSFSLFFRRISPLFNPICQSKCYPSGKCFQNKTWFRFFFSFFRPSSSATRDHAHASTVVLFVWMYSVVCINNAWMFLQRFYSFFCSCSKACSHIVISE